MDENPNANRQLKELHAELHASNCLVIYDRLHKFDQILKIFLENHNDLQTAIVNHNDNVLIDYYDIKARRLLNDNLFHIVRHLHNTVAAASSLVDHSRRFYEKFYQDPNLIPDYHAQTESRFTNHGLCQFVGNLRNFYVHYRTVSLASTLNIDNLQEKHTRTINLLKSDLNQFQRWNSPAKKFLRDQPDSIDLLSIINTYRDHVTSFHDWLGSRLVAIHKQEFDTYDRIMDEIERLQPPPPRNLFSQAKRGNTSPTSPLT